MTGEQIKQVLADNKHQMKDIAEKMGTSLSNLSAGLSKSDIKTGLLEKIAEESQVIILTCHSREADILGKEGKKFALINL